jgi:hypothetical protein
VAILYARYNSANGLTIDKDKMIENENGWELILQCKEEGNNK